MRKKPNKFDKNENKPNAKKVGLFKKKNIFF